MTASAPDIVARLDRLEAKMDRILAALYPDERQLEARAFLDNLSGLSVNEIRARNRERNRRLEEQMRRTA